MKASTKQELYEWFAILSFVLTIYAAGFGALTIFFFIINLCSKFGVSLSPDQTALIFFATALISIPFSILGYHLFAYFKSKVKDCGDKDIKLLKN